MACLPARCLLQLMQIHWRSAAHPGKARAGLNILADTGPLKDGRRAVRIITRQRHIATRREGGLGARGVIAHDPGPGHAQIIAENRPLKAESGAQYPAEPDGGKARGPGVKRGIDHMRRHQAGQTRRDQMQKRDQIPPRDLVIAAPIIRDRNMRIRNHGTMPRKMLAHGGHARLPHALIQAPASRKTRFGSE